MFDIDQEYYRNILENEDLPGTRAEKAQIIAAVREQAGSEANALAASRASQRIAKQWPYAQSDKEVGNRVRAARAYAELSQDDLAAKVEISQPTLARLEKGERTAKRMELREICEITRVPEWWFDGLRKD